MNKNSIIIVAGLVLSGCDGEQPKQAQQICHDEQWKEVPCTQSSGHGHGHVQPMPYNGSPVTAHRDESVERGGFGKTGRAFTGKSSGG